MAARRRHCGALTASCLLLLACASSTAPSPPPRVAASAAQAPRPLPPLRCARETRSARAKDAKLRVQPWRSPRTAALFAGPPAEALPRVEEPRDGTEPYRVHIEDLKARVRDRAARIRAVQEKPVALEVRLATEHVDTHVLEAVVMQIDGQPFLARADLGGAWASVPATRIEIVPGLHRLDVQLVLRADYRGGFFDYVGHCVLSSASIEMWVPPESKDLTVDAIAFRVAGAHPYSAPSMRFEGVRPADVDSFDQ